MKKSIAILLAGMFLAACSGGKTELTFNEVERVQSPGGVLELKVGITPEGEVYPHNTMKDIMDYIDREGLSF